MTSDLVRPAAVAGRFYPADATELRALVVECLAGVPEERLRRRAAIVPHAGLIYSGKCAGAVFGRLSLPATIVILAPNHTGRCKSPGASLWRRGTFATPLGPVAIDEAFAATLEHSSDLVADDPAAHRFEHAIEVELPFLQVLAPGAKIVPLVLSWDDWERSERFGASLADAVLATSGDVLVIASSDMTHYDSAPSAERKDRMALAAIDQLDGYALLEACARAQISMCGRVPVAVVLKAARALGATRARLLDYRHSGAVTGNAASVVTYAGVIIE